MGTFRLKASSVTQSGSYTLFGGTMLEIINQFPFPGANFWSATASGEVIAVPHTTAFFLDGSAIPISMNSASFPTGFNATDAQINISAQQGNPSQWFLRRGPTESVANAASLAYPSSPPVTFNDVLATAYAVRQVSGSGILFCAGLNVTGNYRIENATWAIINLTRPGQNFLPGERGKLYSSDLSYHKFDEVTEIVINEDTTITDFEEQDEEKVEFVIPDDTPPSGPNPVWIKSTAFDGESFLGLLTIIAENTSGIYVITAAKTHDTLYVDSSIDDSTQNVKIPDPFVKTGFVSG